MNAPRPWILLPSSHAARRAIAYFVLPLVATLLGCYATRPPHNLPFRPITHLSELEGTYRNRGEAGKSEGLVLLSNHIWNMGYTNPDWIDAIEVRSIADSALVLRALAGTSVVAESMLVNGKAFKLRKGRLLLKRGFGFPLAVGSPLLGVTHGTLEAGLDREGNGKLTSRGELLGLIFLVLPVAGHGSSEQRFRRIGP